MEGFSGFFVGSDARELLAERGERPPSRGGAVGKMPSRDWRDEDDRRIGAGPSYIFGHDHSGEQTRRDILSY